MTTLLLLYETYARRLRLARKGVIKACFQILLLEFKSTAIHFDVAMLVGYVQQYASSYIAIHILHV